MLQKFHAAAAVVLAVTASTPRVAFADDASVLRADVLFQEGRAAVREGNWERGCPRFEESLRLDPAPGTRINLGECEERSGHLVAASQLYEQALHELGPDDRRVPLARQRAQAVDGRIPRLVVPAEAHVRVDGGRDLQIGELRLDPGRHGIVVVAKGVERSIVLTLVEKERRTLDTETSGPEGTPPPQSSTRQIAG